MPMQGGLAAMLAESGAGKDLVKTAREVESMPGGPELLYTFTAEQMMKDQGIPKKKAEKVRLFKIGGYASANPYKKSDKRYKEWNDKYVEPESRYGNKDIPRSMMKAKGGDVRRAAEKTRRAGRGDDEVILHMSPEEAEVISAMWGPPMVNPNTGMGEYGFLSKVWKKIKKGVKKIVKSKAFRVLAPIALSVFAPGIGTAIGMKLGLAGNAAAIAGNAIVQGGLGAVTGGKEGAIAGALSGGLGAAAGAYGKAAGEALGLSGKTADVVGSALIRGGGEAVTGGDFTTGAIQGGLGAMTRGTQDEFGKDMRRMMGMEAEVPEGQFFARRVSAPGEAPGAAPDAAGDMLAASEEAVMGPTEPTPDDILSGEAPYDPTTGEFRATPPPVTPTAAAQPGKPTFMDMVTKYGVAALPIIEGIRGGDDVVSGGEPPPLPPEFTESLPVYTMNRQFRGLSDPSLYYTYGQAGAPHSGEQIMLNTADPFPLQRPQGGLEGAVGRGGTGVPESTNPRNRIRQRRQMERQGYTYDPDTKMYYPPTTGATRMVAQGGRINQSPVSASDYWTQNQDVPNTIPTVSAKGKYVRGPGTGRSDDIEALLSDGEYVIDAESVALLGDGSGAAGARRLDEMRRNLRKHKAKNLSKGEFTHKAKTPEQYMAKKSKLRRKAKYEHGGVHNVAGTSPLPPTRAAGSNV